MTVAREETFGPAAAILRVNSVDEAITVANGTPFGLGASLWTRDLDRARQLTRQIDCGAVFVNGMVASDPGFRYGYHPGSGCIDHLCFNSEGMHQFFMREPINGIKIELNFSWEEAARMSRLPSWSDAGQNADQPRHPPGARPSGGGHSPSRACGRGRHTAGRAATRA